MVCSYKAKWENPTNHEYIQAALASVQEKGYPMQKAAKEKDVSREMLCCWSLDPFLLLLISVPYIFFLIVWWYTFRSDTFLFILWPAPVRVHPSSGSTWLLVPHYYLHLRALLKVCVLVKIARVSVLYCDKFYLKKRLQLAFCIILH